MDREIRNPLVLLEFTRKVHEGLRGADRRGRNHNRIAAFRDGVDHVRHFIRERAGRMVAVPVCGFVQQENSASRRLRVLLVHRLGTLKPRYSGSILCYGCQSWFTDSKVRTEGVGV
jgi:hypothetical protein